MEGYLKFGLAAVVGYIVSSILFPTPRGFQNIRIPAADMLPSQIPPGAEAGALAIGGGTHPNRNNWQRAYGNDVAGFPMSPEENMAAGPHYSVCSPEALDCGQSLTCGYHKFMCAVGLWK